MPVTPRLNPVPAPKAPHLMRSSDTPASQQTVVNGRIAGYGVSPSHSYEAHSQAPSSGLPSRGLSNGTYEYSRHVLGSVLNDASSRGTRDPVPYPSY
jgi:splicing factor 3B subunit 4